MSLDILDHLWGRAAPKENYTVFKSPTHYNIMTLHTLHIHNIRTVPVLIGPDCHPSLVFPVRIFEDRNERLAKFYCALRNSSRRGLSILSFTSLYKEFFWLASHGSNHKSQQQLVLRGGPSFISYGAISLAEARLFKGVPIFRCMPRALKVEKIFGKWF